ncbi:glycosyltransferase [Lachnospiraceae bacterium 62-35]
MNTSYSALMPLRQGENLEFLEESIHSILEQTIPPQEIVLVMDMPMSGETRWMLMKLCAKRTKLLFVHAYELADFGLEELIMRGIAHCSCSLIAMVGSSDISAPSRCEEGLKIFSEFPQTAVVRSCIGKTGENAADYLTMMFRKEAALEAKKEFWEVTLKVDRESGEGMKAKSQYLETTLVENKSYGEAACGEQGYCSLWKYMEERGYKFYDIPKPLVSFDKTRARAGV